MNIKHFKSSLSLILISILFSINLSAQSSGAEIYCLSDPKIGIFFQPGGSVVISPKLSTKAAGANFENLKSGECAYPEKTYP